MINYELAKELKEAGWPQPEDALAENSDRLFNNGGRTEYVYPPTPSELIEALDDKLFSLERPSLKGPWRAVARWITHSEEGKTLEEAAARLWLALNG